MTTPTSTPPVEGRHEPVVGRFCGQCGLPIDANSSGVRHYGFSIAHPEYQCHALERAERERLTKERDEAIACLREVIGCFEVSCDRVEAHIRGNDPIMERWKRVSGLSSANPGDQLGRSDSNNQNKEKAK